MLVGHSLGGITISAVAEARRRKLKALVYVCALLPTSGKCGKDMTSLEPDTMFRLSRQVSPDGLTYTFARDKLPALFYADVSPEDRYKAMERLRPQPLSISTTPVTLTEDRFGSVPRWYIECTHDNAVRIKLQRLMVKMTPCKVISMECGHSPFFSNPEELAEHLEAIAGLSWGRATPVARHACSKEERHGVARSQANRRTRRSGSRCSRAAWGWPARSDRRTPSAARSGRGRPSSNRST